MQKYLDPKRYRYAIILLKQLVKTDFKLRYQSSALGYVWSLLKPLMMFVVLYVVFTVFLKIGSDIPNYPVYLLLGIVLWNYFSEITTGSVGAIVGKGDLIRKINFPKYVIILAVATSAFINLLINFIVIGIFMIFGGVTLTWGALWSIPLVIELTLLAIAIGFLLSAAFVKLRDVGYIWEVFMQAAFYATPILYPIVMIPLLAQQTLLALPMPQIIQDMRHSLITADTTTGRDVFANSWMLLIPILIVIILIFISVWYFKKNSSSFAEEV